MENFRWNLRVIGLVIRFVFVFLPHSKSGALGLRRAEQKTTRVRRGRVIETCRGAEVGALLVGALRQLPQVGNIGCAETVMRA